MAAGGTKVNQELLFHNWLPVPVLANGFMMKLGSDFQLVVAWVQVFTWCLQGCCINSYK